MSEGPAHWSRRGFLKAAAAVGCATVSLAPAAASTASPRSAVSGGDTGDTGGTRDTGGTGAALFSELDAKIEEAMKAYAIPGAAVGVLLNGEEYIKGYGVTKVDNPVPVDGDTVFRVGSTTKTFTGTALMRLAERGKVQLDAPVRRYLPEFAVADPDVSARVTVRQLLNHSAGWLGDDYQDFGPGDDALARFVTSMARLPQLTPPGEVFAYNNAGLCVAGRIIEELTGTTYEAAVRKLVIDPLGLDHSRFFSDEIVGFNVAASHNVVDGKAVLEPSFWPLPRSLTPTGGLISSVRDQLNWARFHLGNGTAPDGTRLLSRASLAQMRSRPGPGGTLVVELDGMGVTWMLRPTAQGPRIVQHGGTWPGQISGFLMVPDRGFALTLLTNSEGGTRLRDDLFTDDWALNRFAGVTNLPAMATTLSGRELAPYEGRYVAERINDEGAMEDVVIEVDRRNGRLRGTQKSQGETGELGVAFYRRDFGLDLDADGKQIGTRSDFVRGPDGKVAWWRNHGRLYRHQAPSALPN
ncbi:Tat (twin-arginine translocation) pathway signal sequence [Streptomyces sp. cf386]|uniref:serine hydrolase domain-containing protein n=1 Tax=Streptomyces sp. cf386 TaxID=1761904 RepID=UPI00087EA652|nr:serine hydrolase domain-containing protein [Streptomyces sp. cf386]SDO55168.1 Tat (twin-arginine translocation) pathway signal sequence [Streptomyces sp. cf386]